MSHLILFGAGSAGRYALKHLGSAAIACFADNDSVKQEQIIGAVPVYSPEDALKAFPDAEWIACAIRHDYAVEIRQQMKEMGVRTKPLWKCLPVQHGLPPLRCMDSVYNLCADEESRDEWQDQNSFRIRPGEHQQRPPSDIKDIYFPDFITHRDDERMLDAGAANGDTVDAFLSRWKSFEHINAIEPDPQNFAELQNKFFTVPNIYLHQFAVSDHSGSISFTATGDYSARIDEQHGESTVLCTSLDSCVFLPPPTYMKFDLEGHELQALWGARRILKEHNPVLAICAYHESEHFWSIPLLIHALQPEYRLFFRRYAEGSFEIIWYAVPRERVR